MRTIGRTDMAVFPLCLGGNVFGWTASPEQSFAVLDAYAGAGGNFVDTADVYSAWVPGNDGGESEAILGRWMRSRGARDRMVVATKVGMAPGLTGLSAQNIRLAAEASLRRLQTDCIDLYFAHRDDPRTRLDETLAAFDELVREGKVRHIAASNYSPARLGEALAVSGREGLVRFEAVSPHYNLVERGEYEGELAALCQKGQLSCLPYYGLARGFLSGKYRPGASVDSERAESATRYLDPAGLRVLEALDEVGARHRAPPAAVALAWLLRQPKVAAPIASARLPEQLADSLLAASLQLSDEDLGLLAAASEPVARSRQPTGPVRAAGQR